MKRIALYFFLLVALLPGIGLADQTKTKTKNKPPDERTLIVSVDMQKQLIVVASPAKGITTTYLVTPTTTIEIKDKASSIKDVRPGMEVRSCRLQTGETLPQTAEDLVLK